MKEKFFVFCRIAGRVLGLILAIPACVVSMVLFPLNLVLSLIFTRVAKFYLLARCDELIDLAMARFIIEAVLYQMVLKGWAPRELTAAYFNKLPYAKGVSPEAIAKSASLLKTETLNKMFRSDENIINIEEFAVEFIKRGKGEYSDPLSAKVIEILVFTASMHRLHKEFVELVNFRSSHNEMAKISDNALVKLVYLVADDQYLTRFLIKTFRSGVLRSLRTKLQLDLLKEVITKETPSKKSVISLLDAARVNVSLRAHVKLLIHQYGLAPDLLMSQEVMYLSHHEKEFIKQCLMEREDRLVIANGAEALSKLLEKRNLTEYGQRKLIKKELVELYLSYVTQEHLFIANETLKHLFCHAELSVVELLERRFSKDISNSRELEMVLLARKGL